MKEDQKAPLEFLELRKKAEEVLAQTGGGEIVSASLADLQRIIHELHVHQIELEMQNEELRRAQDELAQSRDEYADLYDTAPVGYFTLDLQGLIVRVNPTGVAILGKSRALLYRSAFSGFVIREDQAAFSNHLSQVFKRGFKQICELRLIRNDEWFHAHLESVPVKDSEGGYRHCQTVVLDITERKRAEEILARAKTELVQEVQKRTAELEQKAKELTGEVKQRAAAEAAAQESERRFKAIFEGAEDYIFIKDSSLRYTTVNPAAARLLDIPISRILGRTEEEVFHKGRTEQFRALDMRVLQGDTIQEETTYTVSGRPVTCLETRMPLRDASGEPVGVCIIAHDISDRKRVEYIHEPATEYPSKSMQATLKQAALAAKRNITMLLLGESGSGKDYLARYIHDHSDRANGPYFSINCAAVSADLAESELFGHEKGSFTGAAGRKRGLLELAEGGTLLLNEIGELPLGLQSKLLTFLDTHKFLRVGGEKEISVNARLIAATNRDLGEEVKKGTFRQDLLYRLNVMTITVPSLRERSEDIPVLTQEMLSRIRVDLQLSETPVVNHQGLNALSAYQWPGNVRELRNVLERAVILSRGKEIGPGELGLARADSLDYGDQESSFTVTFPPSGSVNDVTQGLKKFLVKKALLQTKGHRSQAARILGISRDSLKHYMKTLEIADEEEDGK